MKSLVYNGRFSVGGFIRQNFSRSKRNLFFKKKVLSIQKAKVFQAEALSESEERSGSLSASLFLCLCLSYLSLSFSLVSLCMFICLCLLSIFLFSLSTPCWSRECVCDLPGYVPSWNCMLVAGDFPGKGVQTWSCVHQQEGTKFQRTSNSCLASCVRDSEDCFPTPERLCSLSLTGPVL